MADTKPTFRVTVYTDDTDGHFYTVITTDISNVRIAFDSIINLIEMLSHMAILWKDQAEKPWDA